MASEHFSVSWDNFHKNMSLGVNSLLENEDFVDVTLAVEGRHLKAHKMVLSVCSTYFRDLLKTSPCKHPIVFLKDVSYITMCDLLQFMYQGEVQVLQENFDTFIKTAESLKVRGLSGYNTVPEKCSNGPLQEGTRLKNCQPISGRFQNSPSTTPKRARFTKNEAMREKSDFQVTETVSGPGCENSILLKTEPFERENSSLGDDNSNENFYEDSLEASNVEDWMMEGGEESEPGTSADKTEDVSGKEQTIHTLAPKSQKSYEKAYSDFMKWSQSKAVVEYTENVLMSYFSELSEVHKASSIWSYYSKIKATLLFHHNVNIGKFSKLIAFLKRKSGGYKPTRPRTLSRDQVLRFLTEAPDETYLMVKIAAVMGSAGALRCQELLQISLDDIEDEGTTLFVKVKASGRSFHVWNPRDTKLDFIQLYRKYLSLRPPTTPHKRLFIYYNNGKCSTQVVGKNKLGKIPATIADYLKLPDSKLYTGHCLRRTSVIY